MTSGRPNVPNRDRSTLITAIVCGVLVVSGAIAAWELSRRLGMDTQTGRGEAVTPAAIVAHPAGRTGGSLSL